MQDATVSADHFRNSAIDRGAVVQAEIAAHEAARSFAAAFWTQDQTGIHRFYAVRALGQAANAMGFDLVKRPTARDEVA